MQEILREIIKMSACVDTKGLKVVGSDNHTELSAVDNEKDLVVYAHPKKPIPDLKGKFGIPNLKLLENLLSFDAYRSEEVTIERFMRMVPVGTDQEEMEVPKRILFKDKKGGRAVFFFSFGSGIAGADYPQIKFDMDFSPKKEAVKDFAKLSSIFSTPECKHFRAVMEGKNLKFAFGTEGTTTHHAEMVFEEDVSGNLAPNLGWDSNRFNSVMRLIGDRDCRISISNKGVMRITTSTELVEYGYWIRCVKLS